MKRLIVNADDFGYTRGVNSGIIRAHKSGIVSSTTIMACGDAFDHAAELATRTPTLGVGVHLVAVSEKPVASPLAISSLIGVDGRLPGTLTDLSIRIARGAIRIEDVTSEFRAQIERVKKAGIDPTHLDSHKHTHTQPLIMKAAAN